MGLACLGSKVPEGTAGGARGIYVALGRVDDVVVGASDGAGKLAEDDGLLGDVHVLLPAVVCVIQPHTDHLPRVGYGGQEGHLRAWQDVLARLLSPRDRGGKGQI